MPSLGLGYLASVLRNKGHDVKILHSLKEKFNFKDFIRYIKENDFDLIGIQMFTFDLTPTKKHIKIIKKLSPNTTIVLGGYHPSGDPEGTLEFFSDVDFIFSGEAEIGLPKLVETLEKNKNDFKDISNLVWRDKGRIIKNPWKLIENLDEIPFPAWNLMDPRTYPEAPHGGFFKSFPNAPIIITRGCPMQCTFCAGKSVTGNKVRKRSVKNVIEEIKYLKNKFGVNDFLIEDENFTLHKDLVKEFCETLIKNNLNIHWSCPSGVRIDTLDKEMLKLMEKAGCYYLSIGIEFGSQRIHDLTKKHLTLEKIKEKIDLFKYVNIRTAGFFMMGIPGETREEMIKTIKFAKQLRIDRAQFNNFMPLPGSALYKELREKGMEEIDYDHFFVHDVGFVPEGMTKKEMKKLQRKAYLEFYLRPRIILSLLKDLTSFKQFFRLFKRFIDGLK